MGERCSITFPEKWASRVMFEELLHVVTPLTARTMMLRCRLFASRSLFVLAIGLLSACGQATTVNTADGGGSSTSGASCFYSCNLSGGGTSFGCSSGTAAAKTEDDCYQVARDACGPNVGKSGVVSCAECSSSCAPSWYH